MATNLCSVCDTELLDHIICCTGRCKLYYHYSCIGMTRTIFDGYKKVSGLRWQCSNCINEFDTIHTKLDDLTISVNEIKSLINLSGLIKLAVDDAFNRRGHISSDKSAELTSVSSAAHSKKKKKKKQSNADTQNISDSNGKFQSQPTTTPVILDNLPLDIANSTSPMNYSPNASLLDSTIVENVQLNSPLPQSVSDTQPTDEIRVADKRTYLWLSGFHHTTTTKQVILLVSRVLSLDAKEIVCRSLKSGRRTYTDFQHVSFRIGLRSSHANNALKSDKWPVGITCKLFNQKN